MPFSSVSQHIIIPSVTSKTCATGGFHWSKTISTHLGRRPTYCRLPPNYI